MTSLPVVPPHKITFVISHSHTIHGYSLLVGFGGHGIKTGCKWSCGLRQSSTLGLTVVAIKLRLGAVWGLKSTIWISFRLSSEDRGFVFVKVADVERKAV